MGADNVEDMAQKEIAARSRESHNAAGVAQTAHHNFFLPPFRVFIFG